MEAAAHQCKCCRILDGELELSRIRRVARKMKAHGGLDLIVLDYDELIDSPGENKFEQQKNIARFSKSLAVELKCVVILISQLRKTLSGEDAAKPTLQRLYGSGAKQKHASFIILADRPYVRELEGEEKKAKLWLLKSRDGRTARQRLPLVPPRKCNSDEQFRSITEIASTEARPLGRLASHGHDLHSRD